MKFRLLILVLLLMVFNQTVRADDDQLIWAAQVTAGDVLNVQDPPFNAKGDGSTDDTAALQAAIDAASVSGRPIAKILLIPPGTYLISATLRVSGTRYFRMVGGGGGTNLLWRGNSTDPALAVVNASFSEFSDFGISAVADHPLQTGLLLANDPDRPGQSTGNTFRNLAVRSNFQELGIGVQIGRSEGGELKNDGHRFLNCSISNFSDRGVVVRSPVATDLLFYNLIAVGQNARVGLDLLGGSFYWLNGGVANAQTAFAVNAPTGPIEINLSNEEGVGTMLRARAALDGRLELGLDNNRFAHSPDPNFIAIEGPGNIRITRNQLHNFRASPTGFSILRTGAVPGDLFAFQYNRVFGFSPAQAITSAGFFPGQSPTLSCENHYWGWPIDELVAGRYDSTTTATSPADSTELDRQLERMRGLSDSDSLFLGRITNRPTRNSRTGIVGGVIDVSQAPYNARGDGVTDDTAAFQSALGDLQFDGWESGLLLVPAGNYVVSNSLLVGKSASGVNLVGEGSARSRILWRGNGGAVLDFAGIYHGKIRGIGIALEPGASADVGLRVRSLPYWNEIGRCWAVANGGSRNSIADVVIDGSAGTLVSALQVGDDASVPLCDSNNDFHVFQDVVVRGYRETGIDVINSQIYNLVFLDCRVDGAAAGMGFASQTGVKLVAGTLAWFGGGGQNHAVTSLAIMSDGNAPVLFHDATFTGSPQLLNTGGPNFSMVLLNLDHIRFTSNGSSNQFLSFSRPGVNVVENCTFQLNEGQALHHFGDYSPYVPLPSDRPRADALLQAYASLDGFALLGNVIVSSTATADNLFVGSAPTIFSGNQFISDAIAKPRNVEIVVKVLP